ncbi:hypothetical protein ACQ86N_36235 [Puia sp. P3]|uniref:hypothetical protein n=1 Tax=Puia sp. P3 TaxID=3423952 RepID=UPI003D66528C
MTEDTYSSNRAVQYIYLVYCDPRQWVASFDECPNSPTFTAKSEQAVIQTPILPFHRSRHHRTGSRPQYPRRIHQRPARLPFHPNRSREPSLTSFHQPFIPQEASELYTLSNSLTGTWAKTLLSLQVLDQSRPQEYGGILCPTEHIVHGRVGDTIYPFLHMARRTGDHRYIDAAVLLFRWMEAYVSQPDGSWVNERKDSWKGTTVFSTIALCEALRYHGELLDPSFRSEIEARLLKAGNFIYDTVNIDYGNINYPLSASYALSLLGTLQDQPQL